MSNYSTSGIERLINKINERHENLISTLRGRELSEQDLRMHQLSYPHVYINAQDLRIAIDDYAVLLKEAKRYAK